MTTGAYEQPISRSRGNVYEDGIYEDVEVVGEIPLQQSPPSCGETPSVPQRTKKYNTIQVVAIACACIAMLIAVMSLSLVLKQQSEEYKRIKQV